MEFLIVPMASLLAALLTFYSGFGLGTLLLPVFALFFAAETAVIMTALVHLSNNLFKLALLGRHADGGVLVRFALPAIPAAFLGAWLLSRLAAFDAVFSYAWLGAQRQVGPLNIVLGGLILVFALWELLPAAEKWALDRRFLPLGGFLSGFLGGLSGHQGALRSAFLIKSGLGKEAFLATGVVIAVLVDVTRLLVYGARWERFSPEQGIWPLITAVGAALLGSFIGNAYLRKMTLGAVRKWVGAFLVLTGLGLGFGLI